jgi:hypothetical protein
LTNQSGELSSPGKANVNKTVRHLPFDLTKRLERWRRSHDLISAAELDEAALIHGEEGEAVAAARSLLRNEERATASVERQAVALLRKLDLSNEVPDRLKADAGFRLYKWRQRTTFIRATRSARLNSLLFKRRMAA